jgi:hypothetical protein
MCVGMQKWPSSAGASAELVSDIRNLAFNLATARTSISQIRMLGEKESSQAKPMGGDVTH